VGCARKEHYSQSRRRAVVRSSVFGETVTTTTGSSCRRRCPWVGSSVALPALPAGAGSSVKPSQPNAMLQVPSVSTRKTKFKRSSKEPQAIDAGWGVVDDLLLRWATDYVPLAVPGSRLMNVSVLTYVLWRNDDQHRGSALSAVVIKSPKGEWAFRFIKVSPSKPS
jgi:hypothetical protein